MQGEGTVLIYLKNLCQADWVKFNKCWNEFHPLLGNWPFWEMAFIVEAIVQYLRKTLKWFLWKTFIMEQVEWVAKKAWKGLPLSSTLSPQDCHSTLAIGLYHSSRRTVYLWKEQGILKVESSNGITISSINTIYHILSSIERWWWLFLLSFSIGNAFARISCTTETMIIHTYIKFKFQCQLIAI